MVCANENDLKSVIFKTILVTDWISTWFQNEHITPENLSITGRKKSHYWIDCVSYIVRTFSENISIIRH